ncbi:hypothetical protein [Nocardia puris]|uniref:hypothetical protein n=1 Tax=Nocardia puris TaxID=208602 RepID=UPI00082CEA03|nr:hypothetical protein [Nocardia puris]
MTGPGEWGDDGLAEGVDRPVPPVTLLFDAADDAAVTRALLDAGDPATGAITVHPTPGAAGSDGVAHAVLVALGCSPRRLSEQRVSGAETAWQAATAWVVALEIEQVIVLRAHRLAASAIERLLVLRRYTGVRLVLVCHGCAPTVVGEILPPQVAHRVITDVGDALSGVAVRAESAPIAFEAVLPPVPDADVTSFRADCFRSLSAADFARVDAVYRRGMAAACRWMATVPIGETPTGLELPQHLRSLFPVGLSPREMADGAALLASRYTPHELRTLAAGLLCVAAPRVDVRLPARFGDHAVVQRFLAELVIESPSRRHTLTLVRGAQAGCLLHGLLLETPPSLFIGTGPGLSTVAVTGEVVAAILAGTASPVHAAAVATALFTAFPSPTLNVIPISALSADAAVLTVPAGGSRPPSRDRLPRRTCVVAMPAPARPLLHAARVFARLRGTPTDRALLGGGVGLLSRHLHPVAEACGISLPVTSSADSSWHTQVVAWWVGANLHHRGDWTVRDPTQGSR